MGKLHCLIFQWNAFMYPDIKDCFRKFDIDFDCTDFDFDSPDRDKEFEIRLYRKLKSADYDFMFSVNYYTVISNACERAEVKYISWNFDSRLVTMYNKSVFNKCNFIFDFDMVSQREFKAMGANIYYLPLAVNTDRLDKVIISTTEEDARDFSNDVSFVGSLYRLKNQYDQAVEKMPPYLRGYFDASLMAQFDVYGEDVFYKMMTPDIMCRLDEYIKLDKAEESFATSDLTFTVNCLAMKLANMERVELLSLLGGRFDTHLYTDEGEWPAAPGGITLHGPLSYFTQMPIVFNNSSINLNVTLHNIRSGLPLRMFDIMGSGGFLLTNFQAELPTFFENGRDLVFFESFEDCIRKTEYYLSHEDERCTIAENGYRMVKKYHRFDDRIEKMLRFSGII